MFSDVCSISGSIKSAVLEELYSAYWWNSLVFIRILVTGEQMETLPCSVQGAGFRCVVLLCIYYSSPILRM